MKTIIRNIINEEISKLLVGGKSNGMSLEDIAKKHNVPLKSIEHQLKLGIKVEKEHTKFDKVAHRIAMDHLVELPDYYTRLNKMEKDAEK